MKKEIHPENYRLVVFQDVSCDYSFITHSTVKTTETIKWEDGNEYPLYKLEISDKSHPYFTGKQPGGVVSPRRGGDNTTAPAPSPFGAKVRAAGPLRTPEARHSDFRRMSALSNW